VTRDRHLISLENVIMLRTIYFYALVCLGAFVLANMVWAQPPGRIGPMPGKIVPTGPSGPVLPRKIDPPAKVDMKLMPLDVFGKKVEPKLDKKVVPIDPIVKKVEPKLDKKILPIDPIVKKVEPKVDPNVLGPLVLPKPMDDKIVATPAIKLAKDVKFDVKDLTKIKPPIDLTKVKADTLIKMKPPADFKVKPIDLAKIQLPADAIKVGKLGAKLDLGDAKFVLNKDFIKVKDYHLKHGVKTGFGYCYPGHHHCHWHHCIWDPCCGCHYYYDPCCSCYYYWSEPYGCYYPCWWFVDYCDCYYPWWVCGGFEHHGYHCHPGFRVGIRIGW
jgi:hypothetical protein